VERVILDAGLRAKLGDLTNPFPIYDESGRIVVYVTPAEDRSLYEGVDLGASTEELMRREQEGGGRSLREIMVDLESQS
jgi:hypothetical protein